MGKAVVFWKLPFAHYKFFTITHEVCSIDEGNMKYTLKMSLAAFALTASFFPNFSPAQSVATNSQPAATGRAVQISPAGAGTAVEPRLFFYAVLATGS